MKESGNNPSYLDTLLDLPFPFIPLSLSERKTISSPTISRLFVSSGTAGIAKGVKVYKVYKRLSIDSLCESACLLSHLCVSVENGKNDDNQLDNQFPDTQEGIASWKWNEKENMTERVRSIEVFFSWFPSFEHQKHTDDANVHRELSCSPSSLCDDHLVLLIEICCKILSLEYLFRSVYEEHRTQNVQYVQYVQYSVS